MGHKEKSATVRVGVDTGGTFTDFVIWRDGRLANRKVLSTPRDPSLAIIEGVGDILKDSPAVFVVHGTTVATNALLERKGGRIALITTTGFEDVLAIGRQTRRILYASAGEPVELIPAALGSGWRKGRPPPGASSGRSAEAEVAP